MNSTDSGSSLIRSEIDTPDIRKLKKIGQETGFKPQDRIEAYLKIFRHKLPELEKLGEQALDLYRKDDIVGRIL